LGTMARSLQESDRKRTDRIVCELVRQLAGRGNTNTKMLLIALGNAAWPKATPTLAHYLCSSSSELRSIAAASLRWIETDRARTLLARSVTSDPDAMVRREAA